MSQTSLEGARHARRFLDPDTMTDPQTHATQGALIEVFGLLSDKIEASHKSLRESVSIMTDRMDLRQTAHDREDRLVADRVLILENNRLRDREEATRDRDRIAKDLDRRMATISILVGVVVFIVGHYWK